MRWRAVAFSVVISSALLAQETSRDAMLELLATLGPQASEAAKRGFDGLDPAVREKLVATLATLVVDLRDAALDRGVEEMPAEIRDALTGFVPPEILDGMRWRVDGDARSIGLNVFQVGSIRAVTLDHVVLFSDLSETADVTLWAHEIFHVMQYQQWGVDGFVTRYLADHRAVERDAQEFRWKWMKATGRVPTG